MSASPSRAAWTTPAVVAVALASAAAVVVLLTLGRAWLQPPLEVALTLAVAVISFVAAVIVARAIPGHVAAPLLAANGAVVVVTTLVRTDALGPFAGSWMLLYLPLALLMLVMPTGRTASRRWIAVGWSLVGVVVAFNALCALQWFDPSLVEPTTPPGLVLLLGFLGLLIASAAAPVMRYRGSDEPARVQLRWVLVAAASLPLTLLLCWASYLLVGGPDLVGIGLVLMFVAIPAGVTIALTRPRLFDVDRAAVATASAVVLSVAVLTVLSIASGVAGLALVAWSPVAAISTTAALTVAAVAAFGWVRRAFDRLLYPERGRALAALRELTTRIEAGDGDPEEVQTVLRGALRDPHLVVALRRLGDGSLESLDGTPADTGPAAAPVRVRGEEIGLLVPSREHPQRPAAAVAQAAAPLVDAARSRAELNRAMAEVEASRARLLRAGYEERRRLERDLHDGAQQRLVALGMRLRVLQRGGTVTDGVSESLDAAVAELGTAVAELRQLAQGVRPSALDDGLGPALAALLRQSPAPIELDVATLDLPDAVATTAYFVVSESVTNALRHADATRIRVLVRPGQGVVRVVVADDGRGGATTQPAGGLTGLADRVAALGGRIAVSSPPGEGTTVEAELPCAS